MYNGNSSHTLFFVLATASHSKYPFVFYPPTQQYIYVDSLPFRLISLSIITECIFTPLPPFHLLPSSDCSILIICPHLP